MWHVNYLQPMPQLHLRSHAHSCMMYLPEKWQNRAQVTDKDSSALTTVQIRVVCSLFYPKVQQCRQDSRASSQETTSFCTAVGFTYSCSSVFFWESFYWTASSLFNAGFLSPIPWFEQNIFFNYLIQSSSLPFTVVGYSCCYFWALVSRQRHLPLHLTLGQVVSLISRQFPSFHTHAQISLNSHFL